MREPTSVQTAAARDSTADWERVGVLNARLMQGTDGATPRLSRADAEEVLRVFLEHTTAAKRFPSGKSLAWDGDWKEKLQQVLCADGVIEFTFRPPHAQESFTVRLPCQTFKDVAGRVTDGSFEQSCQRLLRLLMHTSKVRARCPHCQRQMMKATLRTHLNPKRRGESATDACVRLQQHQLRECGLQDENRQLRRQRQQPHPLRLGGGKGSPDTRDTTHARREGSSARKRPLTPRGQNAAQRYLAYDSPTQQQRGSTCKKQKEGEPSPCTALCRQYLATKDKELLDLLPPRRLTVYRNR